MNQNNDNENFTESLEDNQSQLIMRLDYRIGKGALWGDYDFWVAVLAGLTAGVILIPVEVAIRALAKKIAETLKTSRAEKDEFQSSRFDLLIPAKNNSWIVLRVMRSAKFRTNAIISEEDIYNAIISSVQSFKKVFEKNPSRTYLVTAELTNMSNQINLRIDTEPDIEIDSLPGVKSQIDFANSGKPIRVKYK